MLIQEAINAFIQLAIVLIISAIAYFALGRGKGGLSAFIGLQAPTSRAMLFALASTLILAPATIGLFMLPALHELATGSNTVAGQFRGRELDADAFAAVAIMAFLKTALSEEIFFRGLIAKRFISWFGFHVGNAVQSVLFGGVHLLIFVVPGGPVFDPLIAALFFSVTGAGGWFMAFLNEKLGNGSIAPSWLLHGLTNAIAYPTLAYL